MKPQPAVASRRTGAPAKASGAAAVLAPPPVQAPVPPRTDPNKTDPYKGEEVSKLVFCFALAALFVRFGVLPEVIAYVTGVNTYLLYVTALPAIVAILLSGGLRRVLRQRAPYFWLAFFGWMVLAVPFSFWPGGSAHLVLDYVRTNLPFLLIAGGMAVRWGQIRAVFYTLAAAAVLNLLTSQYFMDTTNGRISLTASGTIGNSNDLAAHLLLVLPFLLFVTLDPKRSLFVRIPLMLGIIYGLRVILGTGSRGALIAIGAVLIFMLWQATGAQRVMALGGGIIVTLIFTVALPSMTRSRLGSLFGEEHAEAEESGASRSYLFKQSVLFTIRHPVFGVGPGQFANFEGNLRHSEGKVGNWHETHCSFTQASSEDGVPALIFFVLGLGSAMLAVGRTYRKARKQGNADIANATFCYLLSMVGFLVASSFLSHAYSFYLPVMIGLAGTISFAGNRMLETSGRAQGVPSRMPAMA